MNIPVVAFFNNKGGVGKTSLVYHLSWMYSDLGIRTVAADLDPQANLTASFLSEDRLEELWPGIDHPKTIFGSIQPLIRGMGDVILPPHLEQVSDYLIGSIALLAGDLMLSSFEDDLSQTWPLCIGGNERAFRVTSSFWRIMQAAAKDHDASLILMDLGPNLGAINRAALISADYVIVPLAPDLFSLQGLNNLGPTLRKWRKDWHERVNKRPLSGPELPAGNMTPVGYIIQQHSVRLDRPVLAYEKWVKRIPGVYREAVLDESAELDVDIKSDPNRIALLKHFRSLIPFAQESRKPVFHLKPADGAIGAHYNAVKSAREDYEKIAREIAKRINLQI
jgi:chromosome partitioning protein